MFVLRCSGISRGRKWKREALCLSQSHEAGTQAIVGSCAQGSDGPRRLKPRVRVEGQRMDPSPWTQNNSLSEKGAVQRRRSCVKISASTRCQSFAVYRVRYTTGEKSPTLQCQIRSPCVSGVRLWMMVQQQSQWQESKRQSRLEIQDVSVGQRNAGAGG